MFYKKIVITLFFSVSFLFFFPLNILAQKAKIYGTVYDFDGNPMPAVSILQKGTVNAAFTNIKGNYHISVSKGDTTTLIFYAFGYQRAERIVVPMSDTKLNIVMHELANNLDDVTVTGHKKQTSTMGKIDPSDAKLITSASGGIEALVKTQMGVSSNNELSSQYTVRGGNYDENSVYINGIEIYRPLLIRSGQQEGLSMINPDMVQSVGFSAGGFDATYGDKMASVLDINYKKPTAFEGSASASMMGASLYVGSASRRFTQITGVRYKTSKNLLNTTDTKAEYNPSFVDVQTYLTYKLSNKWEASFLGNYSKNDYRFTPTTRDTKFGTLSDIKSFKVYFDGWENDQFLTSLGAFTLKGKLNDNIQIGITASAFSSNEQVNYDIRGEYVLTDDNINAGGGQADKGNFIGVGGYQEHARDRLKSKVMNISHFGSLKVDKHKIRWGLSYQKEIISDKTNEWEARDSSGYAIPYNDQLVNLYSNLKSNNSLNSNRYSGYLQDTYKFGYNGGLFSLTYGLRGSYWSFNKELIVSPRASIAYIPSNQNLTFRFATGVYYQSPFYKEFQLPVSDANGNTVIQLNQDIRSQKSIQFVLGGDYQFRKMDRPFKFSTDIYYKMLSNIVPYTVDNVKIVYAGKNMASGYIAGFDTKLFGEFVPGVDSWVSLSLMKTQQNIDGIKVPLPSDQLFNISCFFQDYFPGYNRLKMNMQAHFSQGLPTSPPNGGYEKGYFRTPAYKRIDIGFSWQLLGQNYDIRNRNSFVGAFRNIWLGLDVFNLLDINNTNSYYWISDAFNQQYAVPNYLTGRQLNAKIVVDF